MPPEQKHGPLPFRARSGAVTTTDDAGDIASATEPRRTRHGASPSSDAVDLVASRFRVLGEPLRIRLLQELQAGERSVSDLVEATGASQPNVSKHLRLIQQAGIIGRRHDGNLVYYFITDPGVIDLCEAACSAISRQLTRELALAGTLHDGFAKGEGEPAPSMRQRRRARRGNPSAGR